MKIIAVISVALAAMSNAQDSSSIPAGGSRVRGLSPRLPTKALWDSNAKTQEYVAEAKAIAGQDPDLRFDFEIFCQPSGGSTNENRAKIGLPDSRPHLTPYPTPEPKVSLGIQRLFDN